MKNYTLAIFLFLTISANAQNVGVGTLTPQAPFTVANNKTVLFGSDTLNAGIKMMWLPSKAAYRVGQVGGDAWNTINIGIGSFASGINTIAVGSYSTALGSYTTASENSSIATGDNTTASGPRSTAMNSFTTASGSASTAMGSHTFATGSVSTAMGSQSIATGLSSTAMGFLTTASGQNSTAMGQGTIASGQSSNAMGFQTRASGQTSIATGNNTIAFGENSNAMGFNTMAKAYASVSLGQYDDPIASSNTTSWVATDPLLVLGNGASDAARSNALVVYKNGNTDINGYTQLGKESEGAPAVKTKKIIGYTTPTSANPNTFTYVPHGLSASKILSISVLINASGNYEIMPQSTQAGYTYSVNTDPSGGGQANIAVGVKSAAESGSVMGRPIKIFITYEE